MTLKLSKIIINKPALQLVLDCAECILIKSKYFADITMNMNFLFGR